MSALQAPARRIAAHASMSNGTVPRPLGTRDAGLCKLAGTAKQLSKPDHTPSLQQRGLQARIQPHRPTDCRRCCCSVPRCAAAPAGPPPVVPRAVLLRSLALLSCHAPHLSRAVATGRSRCARRRTRPAGRAATRTSILCSRCRTAPEQRGSRQPGGGLCCPCRKAPPFPFPVARFRSLPAQHRFLCPLCPLCLCAPLAVIG